MRAAGIWLALLALLLATAARAESLKGTHQDAGYLIDKPADWKGGGLVLFAHGYEGEGAGPGTLIPPTIANHLTRRNVAWASSGYRAKGYRPDWFLADILALRALFIENHGKPRWTVIHGLSMGGHVAVAALELHPGLFQGGLIECGVIDGVGHADWLYAYTAAAEYFSGLPLLEAPRPAFDRLVADELPARLGRPGNYTERGRQFDSVVKYLAGGDLPYRLEGLKERFASMARLRDSVLDGTREYARHADTRGIEYDIDPGFGIDKAMLNREIRRVVPEPGARSSASPVFAPFTGKLSAPLIAIHETADFVVPFRLQQDYRRRTIAAGTSHLLVQRVQAKAGHCGLRGTIREDSFDDLVAWMERGVAPAGGDVLGDVRKLGRR